MFDVYHQGIYKDRGTDSGVLKRKYECDHMMAFQHDDHTAHRWVCNSCDLVIEKDMDPFESRQVEAETPQRAQILNEAAELIVGDRNKAYGDPEENHQQIADYWTTYLGYPIKAYDVANMMALLKMARSRTSYKRDTYVDLAGYAAIAGELHRNAAERAALSEREG